jgi:hypothetical protein
MVAQKFSLRRKCGQMYRQKFWPDSNQTCLENGCLLGCSDESLIALMMQAVQTSESSVNSYQSTRRYNPEDSHLHSHRRENLKS